MWYLSSKKVGKTKGCRRARNAEVEGVEDVVSSAVLRVKCWQWLNDVVDVVS